VLVVLGADARAVRGALTGLSVELKLNPDFAEGLASSVRVAAAWAIERRFDALLLTLCDQPLLDHLHLDVLIEVHERAGMVVASRYAGRSAVPALFPARRLTELLSLRGDQGARDLLRAERPIALVPWPEGEIDVDTQLQAARLPAARARADTVKRRQEVS
jgi:molybdenum cofactor cytidylyltransferase